MNSNPLNNSLNHWGWKLNLGCGRTLHSARSQIRTTNRIRQARTNRHALCVRWVEGGGESTGSIPMMATFAAVCFGEWAQRAQCHVAKLTLIRHSYYFYFESESSSLSLLHYDTRRQMRKANFYLFTEQPD